MITNPTGRQDQARRTAWRILKDWIQAQMALLETNMVEMEEIFPPYMLSGEQTLYQALQANQFRALPSGAGEPAAQLLNRLPWRPTRENREHLRQAAVSSAAIESETRPERLRLHLPARKSAMAQLAGSGSAGSSWGRPPAGRRGRRPPCRWHRPRRSAA